MWDPHNKHNLHCTVQYYYCFIKAGLTTVLLVQNTWPLLNKNVVLFDGIVRIYV